LDSKEICGDLIELSFKGKESGIIVSWIEHYWVRGIP